MLIYPPQIFTSHQPTKLTEWVIYKIISPNGRVYIGITSQFKRRMRAYEYSSKNLLSQTLVYCSINKYGYSSHKIEVVEKFISTISYAKGIEMFWIRTYMCNKNKYPERNGLNLTDGGDGAKGCKLSLKRIEQLRLAKLGTKQSEETKMKRSKSMLGKKMNFTHFTPEFLKAMSERARLYKHTEEAKVKIGEASKGNKHRVGHKMTKEQIEHRSSLLRGQKKSPENLKRHIEMVVKTFARPIIQYSLNGEFIKEFPMIVTAKKELGINGAGIHRALSGQCKQSRGFIFKYK